MHCVAGLIAYYFTVQIRSLWRVNSTGKCERQLNALMSKSGVSMMKALEDVVTVNAFQVNVDANGGLMWTKGKERFDKEPGASWWKRTSNYLMRFLPVESQL